MNYRHSMVIQWSDEDNCCLVHLSGIPFGAISHLSGTHEEAAARQED